MHSRRSIEQRAARLGENIAEAAEGRSVSIIAHSMGGLDARYMVSRLKPAGIDVPFELTLCA